MSTPTTQPEPQANKPEPQPIERIKTRRAHYLREIMMTNMELDAAKRRVEELQNHLVKSQGALAAVESLRQEIEGPTPSAPAALEAAAPEAAKPEPTKPKT